MPPKLGILAGGGSLPVRLAESCLSSGRACMVLAFEGQSDDQSLSALDPSVGVVWTRFGAVVTAMEALKEAGVEEIVMAGPVKRPSFTSLRPDKATARVAAKIMKAALGGDDGLLKALIGEIEAMGLTVIGLDEVLGGLLARAGVYGAVKPDSQAQADIQRGVEVARALGALDVGQCVVVQQGLVLGVEAIEGTDAMIERCGDLKREGPGGVLVKLPKPGQERRADLPTVGVETIEKAAAAGLRGIAIEAGSSIIIDEEATVRRADEAGLFLIALTS